jgi:ribosomal protein L3 glutamine methyltransferase
VTSDGRQPGSKPGNRRSRLSTRPRKPAWTAARLIDEGTRRFRAARLRFGHGTSRAEDEAAYLAFHALGLPPDTPGQVLSRQVRQPQAKRVLGLFSERIRTRKPAAYLTREAWLGDFRFYVDERVIVPRSHIAGMLADGLQPWVAGEIRTALDLCTGSGCLAVLLAHAFRGARIDATDISRAALAVARRNVRDYRLLGRIRLVRSDMFSALVGKQYDLIVSNPPYVTGASMRRLPREYRHEPRLALASGRDGLDAARAILLEAASHLYPGGLLVMEVGSGRRRLERAYPRTAFTWAETPGGGDVLVVGRDQLTGLAHPRPEQPATGGLRAAATR